MHVSVFQPSELQKTSPTSVSFAQVLLSDLFWTEILSVQYRIVKKSVVQIVQDKK